MPAESVNPMLLHPPSLDLKRVVRSEVRNIVGQDGSLELNGVPEGVGRPLGGTAGSRGAVSTHAEITFETTLRLRRNYGRNYI